MQAGTDLLHGLWNGINDAVGWIYEQISGMVGSVIDFIKGLFGIASPSKVMRDEVGRWIPEGIGEGIDRNAKSALSPLDDLSDEMTRRMEAASLRASVGFDAPRASRIRADLPRGGRPSQVVIQNMNINARDLRDVRTVEQFSARVLGRELAVL